MHIMFTKVRRLVSEWQGVIGILLISIALSAHLLPQSFGSWANTVFLCSMLAIAIVLSLGWITVQRRGQYLELAKVSTEALGGQSFVDATLRRLALRAVRPQRHGHNYPYDALTRFFARLGYKVNEAGLPAYLPR
jgi:hypothetical protein